MEVESGIESGGVVYVIRVERNTEEAAVGPVNAPDARRKAGACTWGCGGAQSRHLAVNDFDVEVGKFDVIAVCLCRAPDNRQRASTIRILWILYFIYML